MLICLQVKWSVEKPLEPKSFSIDTEECLGTLKTPVQFNDWQIPKSKITVFVDGFLPILGRVLFNQFGISITQKSCLKIEINTVEPLCTIKPS